MATFILAIFTFPKSMFMFWNCNLLFLQLNYVAVSFDDDFYCPRFAARVPQFSHLLTWLSVVPLFCILPFPMLDFCFVRRTTKSSLMAYLNDWYSRHLTHPYKLIRTFSYLCWGVRTVTDLFWLRKYAGWLYSLLFAQDITPVYLEWEWRETMLTKINVKKIAFGNKEYTTG